jgi:perosamine synthetase
MASAITTHSPSVDGHSNGPAMRPGPIPVAGPWITEREIAYVAEAAATAWYANAGTFNARFEAALAAAVGRRHAISLPSCTSGLHLALVAAGVGRDDEVVVPECTWIATAAPIQYVGATPVFADIDPVTWCLSAHSLERAMTPRTRAVIVVDVYGSMPDMDALLRICERHGAVLIEDAAEAIGSQWWGRPAGGFGAASVFSFHGSKTVTTGEGGMVVTDDDALHQRMLVLRDHGRAPGDVAFFNQEVAYKYRMSAVQAAMGLAQMERLEELVERKRQIFGWYEDRLRDIEGLILNAEPPQTRNSYWMVTVLLDPARGLDKEMVARRLYSRGISSRPFFHPLSSLPAYRGTTAAEQGRDRNVVSYRLSPFGVNLPSALCLEEHDVDRVCSEVQQLLGG